MINALLKNGWVLVNLIQVPRNVVWQLWHGLPADATWRLSGLPLLFHAGGNNPISRWLFAKIGKTSQVKIGHHFSALSKPDLNSLSVIQKTMLRTASYGAELRIGNHVGVSGCSICACQKVVIGDHTIVGTGAIITDSDLHPVDPVARMNGGGGKSAPVVIGENVFIGARAIVLKGVTIGDNATVGAGAVVAHDVPAGAIAVGNPARIIR